jgi:hypothetical protein
MTYLDRALLNNPTLSASQIIAEMCPSDIGLEDTSFCQVLEEDLSMSFELCGKCWKREMPHE